MEGERGSSATAAAAAAEGAAAGSTGGTAAANGGAASHLTGRASEPVAGTADGASKPDGGAAGKADADDAPKLLADLVEAVLGAVLIDCGGGAGGLVALWGAYCGLAWAAGMQHEMGLVEQQQG